ncbi:hypothetical protein [Ruegeria profundi]|uniref:hypothetical protein n=1 Tax=Ruegeria profundi TaxID=1685378 RepID=UPI003C7DA9B8
MTPVQATLIGVAIASALALTAQAETPEEISARVLAAQDEDSLLATWEIWHPKATHRIVLKYGAGQEDDVFTYRVGDVAAATDAELPKELADYKETKRSTPRMTTRTEDEVHHVTAVTDVEYDWQGYAGKMRQTDEFAFEPYLGGMVVRSLTTTYDYR